MPSKSHFLVHFIPGILLGSVVGLAFGSLLVATQIPRVITTRSPAVVEDEADEPRMLTVGKLSLQYPDDWHVLTETAFDNPRRVLPEYKAFIDPNPIHFNSPSDGPMPRAKISVYATDEGEAILAPYEGDQYISNITDEITINGQQATRLRLTAGPEAAYTPPYQEIIFIGGYEVKYEYEEITERDDPSWLLIKNSLKVSGAQASSVPNGTIIKRSCVTGGDNNHCLSLRQGDYLPTGTGILTGRYLGIQTFEDAWVAGKTVSCPVFEIDGGSDLIISGLNKLVASGSGIVPLKDGKFLWRMGKQLPTNMIGTIEHAVKVYVQVPPQPEAGVDSCYSPFVPVSATEEL